MKLIEYTNHGAPHEVCRCVETAEPGEPGPGEVVVAVEASAINPADLLIIEGRYPGPAELPARQGSRGPVVSRLWATVSKTLPRVTG